MRAALGQWKPEVVLNFLGYELADVQADFELFKGTVRQYVFISSATVYVKPPPVLPITEDAPLGNAWWEYAQKKLACERWLLEQHAQTGFPVTIVRPSHTYSKLWIPNPVSSSSFTFTLRVEQGMRVFVPDDGENLWTLTAASDFAAGLAGLVGNQKSIGEAYHITSDEVLTWNQIIGEIAAALGVAPREVYRIPTDFICQVAPQMTGSLKGDKAHPGVFDNTKIKRFVPGFLCRKPLRVGVPESLAWLRAHPEQQNLNPKVDALCDQVIEAWQARRASGTDAGAD
jgi:nucleoside-diphosphate-sugar epimerase